MTHQNHQDFRCYLLETFEDRRQRNPAYSMRAFARDLQISASRLNDILKNRYGISPAAAQKISQKLHLSEAESDHFLKLVLAKHSRVRSEREKALQSIQVSQASLKEKKIGLDQFKFMADWYHLALLELLSLKTIKHGYEVFAGKLGISETLVREAIARLERLGLLERTKLGFKALQDYTKVNSSSIPSRYIRKFHSQIIEKALHAIEGQSPSDRLLNALVLPVDKRNMKRAQELINEFKVKFHAEISCTENTESVYALSIQFFELTKEVPNDQNA